MHECNKHTFIYLYYAVKKLICLIGVCLHHKINVHKIILKTL